MALEEYRIYLLDIGELTEGDGGCPEGEVLTEGQEATQTGEQKATQKEAQGAVRKEAQAETQTEPQEGQEAYEGELMEEALRKVDSVRRRKAEALKSRPVRAASLGAGLLLQKAVMDLGDSGAPTVIRLTLRELLGQLTAPRELAYRYGEKGKPYLADIPLYFSLSHSGRFVLCAVSGREIGADIQKIRKGSEERIARRFFAAQEQEALAACSDEEARLRLFYELWAKKEAYGKLTGQGIASAVLESVLSGQGIEWATVDVPEAYAAAVCMRRGE